MTSPCIKMLAINKNRFSVQARKYLSLTNKLLPEHTSLCYDTADQIKLDVIGRTFACVPVHATEKSINHYLQRASGQAVKNNVNIIVFINATKNELGPDVFKRKVSSAIRLANKINNIYGKTFISVISAHLDDHPSMGRVRKILTDSAIIFCLKNIIYDPIFICNDIDQKAISATYFNDIISAFHTTRCPIFVSGPVAYGYLDKKPIAIPSNIGIPELYLFNKVQNCINYCTRKGIIGGEPRTWPEGANMSFCGTAYCSAGGFSYEQLNGEDDMMGIALTELFINYSADWQEPLFIDTAWVATDPRRVLSSILSGRTGMEAWSWQKFTDTLGSTLDTLSLTREYAKSSWLLTEEDIDSLAKTNNIELATKLQSRIQWVFFRSAIFDRRTKDSRQLESLSSEFGIKIKECKLDRNKGDFFAIVDWKNSDIIHDIIKIFSK